MLNFLFCRYLEILLGTYFKKFLLNRDDKLSLLVIVRKRNINLSLEEYVVVLSKSSGNHQKVMLRTLTLAKTKDIHQPRQPG